jgi:hypothetical protein
MAVILKGDAFKITPLSDEEQYVAQDQITTWKFEVTPRKAGTQHLAICVSLRVPASPAQVLRKTIDIREEKIDVQAGLGQFPKVIAASWQWYVGTAVTAAGVVLSAIYH